jgi:hypothetical protein
MDILAHQGGWDEILLVLGPIAVFAGLLWVASRRLNRRLEADAQPDRDTEAPSAPSRPTRSS